jgi:hypothetical protein
MLRHPDHMATNESASGKCSGLRHLAPESRRTPRFRLHRLAIQPIGSVWKFVSDYSSATASELHGVPFLDLLSIIDSQRTGLAIDPEFDGGKRFVRRPKVFGNRFIV